MILYFNFKVHLQDRGQPLRVDGRHHELRRRADGAVDALPREHRAAEEGGGGDGARRDDAEPDDDLGRLVDAGRGGDDAQAEVQPPPRRERGQARRHPLDV